MKLETDFGAPAKPSRLVNELLATISACLVVLTTFNYISCESRKLVKTNMFYMWRSQEISFGIELGAESSEQRTAVQREANVLCLTRNSIAEIQYVVK